MEVIGGRGGPVDCRIVMNGQSKQLLMSVLMSFIMPHTCTPTHLPANLGALAFRGFHTMHPLVRRHLGRCPALLLEKRLILQLIHLDMQRPTALDHILLAILTESPQGQISARTGTYNVSFALSIHALLTQRHEQILLGQELNRIPLLRGTWLHEIPPLFIQPRHLKDINHVMHISFVETKGLHSPHKV